jgi:hypothetical protein
VSGNDVQDKVILVFWVSRHYLLQSEVGMTEKIH